MTAGGRLPPLAIDATLWQTPLWSGARRVLQAMAAAGHDAVVVGGAVRDLLLGREVTEIDIATSMTPEEMLRRFPRAHPTGRRFGTVTIIEGGRSYEATTFRREVYDGSDRRPQVIFGASLAEDLARRDFTINAMALDLGARLIDPFGGAADLARRTLRAVGEPRDRFHEDPLRLIRALRLAARYDLDIEEETWRALVDSRASLSRVAPERIIAEVDKMLKHTPALRVFRLFDRADLWLKIRDVGVLAVLAPEDPPEIVWSAIALGTEPTRGFCPKAPVPDPPGRFVLDLPLPRPVRRTVEQAIRLAARAVGDEDRDGRNAELLRPSKRRPRSLEALFAAVGRFDAAGDGIDGRSEIACGGRNQAGGRHLEDVRFDDGRDAEELLYAWGMRGARDAYRTLRLEALFSGRPRSATLRLFRALAEDYARLPAPNTRRIAFDFEAWKSARDVPDGPHLRRLAEAIWRAVNLDGVPNTPEALTAFADRWWAAYGEPVGR
ncbi:MAG: hypothetical protein IMW86_06130 [Hydrogenibacillus sp.]|nr:hypothetical protein [Hydrogenibacillus sp.]